MNKIEQYLNSRGHYNDETGELLVGIYNTIMNNLETESEGDEWLDYDIVEDIVQDAFMYHIRMKM